MTTTKLGVLPWSQASDWPAFEAYARRVEAFGWRSITIDGHSLPQILDAFHEVAAETERPTMIPRAAPAVTSLAQ